MAPQRHEQSARLAVIVRILVRLWDGARRQHERLRAATESPLALLSVLAVPRTGVRNPALRARPIFMRGIARATASESAWKRLPDDTFMMES